MSESPYTRSRGERDGFDIVSLPADATLQTELPMNMKPIIPNIYSDSSYYDTTQAGLSSSAPPLEAHPSHPIHCHTSLHPAHNFPPCPPRQEDSQSFAPKKQRRSEKAIMAKDDRQGRHVHRCHLCARQFALPNGLAIHLKWHKEGPANQETKELESTSQSVVDASTRESPVPPVQLHAVRYDPGDNHAEYDIDPLMVMPPYLPKWRSAELAPSASPLREGLAVDQFPEPLENRNGLGLFLPPAALSSPHAPTVHSFDVPLAPLCIPDTRSSFGPQGPEYRHLPLDQSPDNAVSWQRYRDSPGPPGADDSKVRRALRSP
ncbi:hypothetical protein NEOLEDRAFT_1125889 [Neolentinus lepideus HHB14362 ss-1]|uniref:C2H2-type domain-containing protein n=1 Tax=Neolentinus lepideus HHB14362 ss-1 TaxID=1314782 RepID=A0A165VY30_9AGAM|nr:hypothetical protein NEOLEDRAFT_1125889 [Neolentinus lepideus HHB14362 ss-1]